MGGLVLNIYAEHNSVVGVVLLHVVYWYMNVVWAKGITPCLVKYVCVCVCLCICGTWRVHIISVVARNVHIMSVTTSVA